MDASSITADSISIYDTLTRTPLAVVQCSFADAPSLEAQLVTAPGSLRLCLDAACTTPVAPAPGDSTPLSAPAGMGLQAATTAFNFDGLGRPSITSALTLTVLAADGSSTAMGVTIQPETGHVATF